MYLLTKIHRMPIATQPIIFVNGTILYGIDQWVYHKLQCLVKEFPQRFPYFIQSSQHMVDKVWVSQLPDTCQFVSYNAVSMNTKTDTTHVLHVLSHFFKIFFLKLFTQVSFQNLPLSWPILFFNLCWHGGSNWVGLQWVLHQPPCMPRYTTASIRSIISFNLTTKLYSMVLTLTLPLLFGILLEPFNNPSQISLNFKEK